MIAAFFTKVAQYGQKIAIRKPGCPGRMLAGPIVALSALAGGVAQAGAAQAAPQVVADIAPVHSIVARVMEGVGTPSLLLPPGASPHGYAMRPAEAQALDRAGLVFRVGAGLTPWLEEAVETLAQDAVIVDLSGVEGVLRLPFREGVRFEAHDHGDHGHDDHDDHGHDDHDGHEDHGDHDDHEEHAGHEGHDDHDDHDHHGQIDPHLWLDPRNAAIWVEVIAAHLAEADPENAARYRENAAAARAEIATLETVLLEQLAPVQGRPFIVFHDAYHYFEARFGVEAAGAISLGDATAPGPRRLRDIRDTLHESGAACVFAEPQHPAKLIRTVTEGSDVRIATLDPLGASLEPGPALYPQVLRDMATALSGCLAAR